MVGPSSSSRPRSAGDGFAYVVSTPSTPPAPGPPTPAPPGSSAAAAPGPAPVQRGSTAISGVATARLFGRRLRFQEREDAGARARTSSATSACSRVLALTLRASIDPQPDGARGKRRRGAGWRAREPRSPAVKPPPSCGSSRLRGAGRFAVAVSAPLSSARRAIARSKRRGSPVTDPDRVACQAPPAPAVDLGAPGSVQRRGATM
jgi:hypothetical protein